MSFGFVLLLVLMVAVLVVLFVGLGLMLKGGKMNEKYGNKLMVWRVGLQAAALLVLGALVLSSS